MPKIHSLLLLIALVFSAAHARGESVPLEQWRKQRAANLTS